MSLSNTFYHVGIFFFFLIQRIIFSNASRHTVNTGKGLVSVSVLLKAQERSCHFPIQ